MKIYTPQSFRQFLSLLCTAMSVPAIPASVSAEEPAAVVENTAPATAYAELRSSRKNGCRILPAGCGD